MNVPGYELLEVFARNSTATFYRARHRVTGQSACVEWFSTFGQEWPIPMLERRLHILQTVALLAHPYVWPVLQVGEFERSHFLVRPLYSAQFLDAVTRTSQPTEEQVVTWMHQLAQAVQHAHDHGIYHGDLKPGNVMVEFDAKGQVHPRLGGFDTAEVRQMPPRLERPDVPGNMLYGTPVYLAPERLQSPSPRVTEASDIWSLGVMFYQLLVGRMPFTGSTVADLFLATIQSEPAAPHLLVPAIRPEVEAVVLRCLRKDPSERYSTAQALADELAALQHRESQPPPRGNPTPGWRTWFSRWI
ncbi:MAG: serine/threonine-protein kinase [Gemmataceae bacterium]